MGGGKLDSKIGGYEEKKRIWCIIRTEMTNNTQIEFALRFMPFHCLYFLCNRSMFGNEKTPSLTMLLNCFSAIKCISIYNKQIRRRKFLTCIHVCFILFAEENHDHDLPGGFNHHPGGSPRWLPVMTSDRTSMDSPPGIHPPKI